MTPYSTFNFVVNLSSPGVDLISALGGFTEVSGLVSETVVAEPRASSASDSHVTLKRGVINSHELFAWLNQARNKAPNARRDVTITLRDETGIPVRRWRLRSVLPLKYTGPALAAKGGDVAMEELVLSAEGVVVE